MYIEKKRNKKDTSLAIKYPYFCNCFVFIYDMHKINPCQNKKKTA